MKQQNFFLIALCLVSLLTLANMDAQAQSRLELETPTDGSSDVILNSATGNNTIFKIQGSEKMRLTSTGELGINKLYFAPGNNWDTNVHSHLLNRMFIYTTSESQGMFFSSYGTNADIRFQTGSWHNNPGNSLILANNGNVGIGTTSPSFKLDINGSIRYYGAPTQSSDARFKKDIQTLTASKIEKLDQVRGTSYQFRTEDFKDKNFLKGTQMGVIAQELIKVYPELVSKDAEGYYSVNYTGLIPVLVEAVKDLRKKNEQLQAKVGQVEEIKAQSKLLEARLEALEKLLIKAKK